MRRNGYATWQRKACKLELTSRSRTRSRTRTQIQVPLSIELATPTTYHSEWSSAQLFCPRHDVSSKLRALQLETSVKEYEHIYQNLLWLGVTELERLDMVNRIFTPKNTHLLGEQLDTNVVNKIPTALPSFRQRKKVRYDWLLHYGTCSCVPYITSKASTFTGLHLLYNVFMHASAKKIAT